MYRSEWNDGICENRDSTTATTMMKWYSFRGPSGARLEYIIC
jgi:hypothetical protein